VLGLVDAYAGRFPEGRRKCEERLAICQALDDYRSVAEYTSYLAVVCSFEGDLEAGERLAREALAAWRRLGDSVGVAQALDALGVALCLGEEYAEAQSVLEDHVAVGTYLEKFQLHCLSSTGVARAQQGEYGTARHDFAAGLRLAQESGILSGAARYNSLLGWLEVREAAYLGARRRLSESVATFDKCHFRDRAVAWRCILAYAERSLGNAVDARRFTLQALTWARERASFRVLLDVLRLAALLLLEEGKAERAVEIYALACTFPAIANGQWYEDVVGRPIVEAAQVLPAAVVNAAKERGRALDVQAALDELIEHFAA
jgi:tetratricopeptide (TPR) repeat protein